MSKFLKLIESCQNGLGGPGDEPGDKAVMQALYTAGHKLHSSTSGCFGFTDKESGQKFNVTVEEVSEDEELRDIDETEDAVDKAAVATKMADKATEDDPRTAQTKKNLGVQVGRTYQELERGLRDATRKLKI
jgi:hypothetical protein